MTAGQFLVSLSVLLALLIGGVLWLARSGAEDGKRWLNDD